MKASFWKILPRLVLFSGMTLLGFQIWSLAHLTFQEATVQSVEQYEGKCRLRIGKYLPCDRYRAVVQFMPPGTISPILATVEAGERGQRLEVRDMVKVMYNRAEPEGAVLASLSDGWIFPTALLVVGGVLVLITSSKKESPEGRTVVPTQLTT
jgi:hypothetical protein